MREKLEPILHSLGFFLIGALISYGQLLSGEGNMTARLIIGRALTVGGLAMAAGAVLMFFPELPYVGQLGVAAALASFGASTIEKLAYRVLSLRGVTK